MSIVEKLDSKYYDQLFIECNSVYEPKNDSETKEFEIKIIFFIKDVSKNKLSKK